MENNYEENPQIKYSRCLFSSFYALATNMSFITGILINTSA
jgi:hypothetical protein